MRMKRQRNHFPLLTHARSTALDQRPMPKVHTIKVPNRQGNRSVLVWVVLGSHTKV